MIYIILSPGRTGSILLTDIVYKYICNNLNFADEVRYFWYDNQPPVTFNTDKDCVVHTHSSEIISKLEIDPSNVTLIISKRYNLFDLTMSDIISYVTHECTRYTGQQKEPFSIPITIFLKYIEHYKKWYENIDLSLNYYDVKTIFYEDFIDDYSYIGKLLNFPHLEKINIETEKSPYDYKDLVVNWEILKFIYEHQVIGNYIID